MDDSIPATLAGAGTRLTANFVWPHLDIIMVWHAHS
jgi:hypothetical protein